MKLGKRRIRLDLGRAEHLPERLLDSLLDAADLAAQRGEPAAGGIEHLAPVVEASLDGDGEAREFAHALPEAAQPRELVADPGEPAVEVADGPQRLDRLGQLFGLEHAPLLGSSHELANVVQAAERGPQAGAECLDHLGRERLAVVDLAGVDARLDAVRRGLAQRAGRASGDQCADLVEVEKLERVRVHVHLTTAI